MEKVEVGDLVNEKTLSFARYSITDRAIPSSLDGLKKIHRRIIFSMNKDGLKYNKFRTKSTNATGSVFQYSPHGDSYDTMVRLANDSVVYQLVDGKGAFGTVVSRDGGHGHARYTEVRLAEIAEALVDGLNKNAVDMSLTYDEKRYEPTVLPVKFPLILANPNEGIASGIATKIPSFDLKDIRDNVDLLLKGKEMIPMYPTFATGGLVLRDEKVAQQVQDSGRGMYKMRGTYHLEDNDKIIIDSLPYGSKVEVIEEQIINLKSKNILPMITYVNEDTDAQGFRLRIEVKKNTDRDELMKILYSKTSLQSNFSCNMFVLDSDGKPKLWGTKNILLSWIRFRAKTITRIANFDINKIKEELNTLYGLQQAIKEIDTVIELIKSNTEEKVVESLVGTGRYNQEQAEYLTQLSLRALNKTNIQKKIKKIKELEKELQRLEQLVNNKNLIAKEILSGIDSVVEKHYIPRQTKIVDEFETVNVKEIVETNNDYNVKVIVTKDNYVKKIPLTSLRGNYTIKYKDGDSALVELETKNSEELLVFTDKHNVYKKRFSELADTKPSELGNYIPSLISVDDDENILSIIALNEDVKHILFGFDNGKVAKIETESYRTKTNRTMLKNAYAPQKALVIVGMTDDFDLLSKTVKGKTILMNTNRIGSKSAKTSQGVAFQKLNDNDSVEEYQVITDSSQLEYYRVKSSGKGKNWKGTV